jgi:hypothetical protein
MKKLKKAYNYLKLQIPKLILQRKIKKIGRYMGDVNSFMLVCGWDRNRRREYWRSIIQAVKKFS